MSAVCLQSVAGLRPRTQRYKEPAHSELELIACRNCEVVQCNDAWSTAIVQETHTSKQSGEPTWARMSWVSGYELVGARGTGGW